MTFRNKPFLHFWSKGCFIVFFLIPVLSIAQKPLKIKYTPAGIFALGIRAPFSIAGSPNGVSLAQGIGCEARIQLGRHYNTEWFVEFLRGNYGDVSVRSDLHIGGEFMLYPQLRLGRVQPFIAIGPMADYSKVHEQADKENAAARWSLAAEAGLGLHINVTWRTDITISAQYLLSFGEKIEPVITGDQVVYTKGSGTDGHLMLTLSMNFKMLDLWKKIRW